MNNLCDKNVFWFDVIKHYRRAYALCITNKADEFLSECINFNINIKRENKHLNLDSWIRHGATKIGDIIDDNGNYYDYVDFKDKFPTVTTNHREYLQIINSIKQYQNKVNITLNRNDKRNELPKFWQTLVNGDNKNIYCLIKRTPKKSQAFTKWENIYNEQIEWKRAFIKVFKTTSDSKLKWFQIRTLYRLIPTNRFLHIRKIKNSPNCTFGCNEEETLNHLFYQCPKVLNFWKDILNWVKNNCANCDNLSFSEQLIILGYRNNVFTDKVIDLLIVIAKWHLYKCKLQGREPNIEIFKQEFKERYVIEKHIHTSRSNIDNFNDVWLQYRNLLR